MLTEGKVTMADQLEKSFQKQPLFHNTKFATTSKKVGGKDRRWYKDVGLGFKVSFPPPLTSRALLGER